jgi:hypothetical protein
MPTIQLTLHALRPNSSSQEGPPTWTWGKENVCHPQDPSELEQLRRLPCLHSPLRNDSQALVAYACNPSYLGGWDPEDHSSRPAWVKSSQDLGEKFTRPISNTSWMQGCPPVIPSYAGGWDGEDCGSWPAGAKKFLGNSISVKKNVSVVFILCSKERFYRGAPLQR